MDCLRLKNGYCHSLLQVFVFIFIPGKITNNNYLLQILKEVEPVNAENVKI